MKRPVIDYTIPCEHERARRVALAERPTVTVMCGGCGSVIRDPRGVSLARCPHCDVLAGESLREHLPFCPERPSA